MIIANPIYDVVFKRMMENERVSKFFIGTLLEETIETVEVKPQEFTYTDELSALAVFRLDFIATIKTNSGERKKVLIEIQKAKNQIDLMRFRKYLAEQYKKEDLINEEKVILPITTIYILGFNLPEIDTPCLKVERNYVDRIEKTNLNTKSDFVEKLTHDSYIVQVERITKRYKTKLDKQLQQFLESEENKNIFTANYLTANEQEILVKNKFEQTTYQWKSIINKVEIDTHYFLFTNSVQAIIIPKTAFINNADKVTFDKILSATLPLEIQLKQDIRNGGK